jgi:lysophospholipid acyltransferase (LPLAT)-like uncharacterized protein
MKDKLIRFGLIHYINLVYRTSKFEYENKQVIENCEKGYLVSFWHGDSYCLFPTMKGTKIGIITTINKRGDFIADLCNYFEYMPLRVSDEPTEKNMIFKLSSDMRKNKDLHVGLAADGPLGPYHVPKDFLFVLGEMTNRQVLPVNVKVKRKVVLFRRWDKYKVPLPFNRFKLSFGTPMTVTKEDRKTEYVRLKQNLLSQMTEMENK